jgi:very-short-patch-repair endonuclease
MKKYSFPQTKNAKQYSRENRKSWNPYEICMWKYILNNKSVMKYKWTRQKPIESYILDFYCAKLRLAIEIDGSSHTENKFYDELRTMLLREYNIIVIRYQNKDIRYNLEYVCDDLLAKIKKREDELFTHPCLFPIE